MLVSCIIVTYNQEEELYTAIDSVLCQDYSEIELIVTDDGSRNFSSKKIEKYIKYKAQKNIIKYRVIANKENMGTVKNINGVLRECTGEVVMPLAGDDSFYDSYVVSRVVHRFTENQCKILLCSRVEKSCDGKIRLLPKIQDYSYIYKLDTADKQYKAIGMGKGFDFASGAAMYYTLNYIKEVGYYDEKYKLWEDGPFIARATRSGVKLDMAYDLITTRYSCNGISSKRKNDIPKSIYQDYCKFIPKEYLAYKGCFNKYELGVLGGIYMLNKNRGRISIGIVFKYPQFLVNVINIRLIRIINRITGKRKKNICKQ